MASEMQNPALVGTGVCDNNLAGKQIARKDKQAPEQNQLIARVRKSSREEFRISVRRFADGTRKCDVTVWQLDPKGAWRPTPRNIVIGASAISAVIRGIAAAEEQLWEVAR